MANEARVTVGLSILKRSGAVTILDEKYMAVFTPTVTGTKGPSPGALTIPVYGKVIPLTELTTPGLCMLRNLDATNYVEWGLYDPQIDQFYPLGEIQPGESYVLRFSRNIREQYEGTGTGTTAVGGVEFFMKANAADVVVSVEAFEA